MSVAPQISVRLAIAFTVLKHKPKDQSIPSYLLGLQSLFSLSNDSQATCGEDAWRNHALSLERELESLKQKREDDETELIRLRQNATKDMPDDSDAAPSKKKTKKGGKAQELQLQDDDWPAKREERLNATGQSSPSLAAAFTSLRSVLNSVSPQTGDDPPHNSRLLAAITRTIDTIGKFLGLQNISTSSVPSELNELRIAMASPLLVYVLRIALPALFYQDIRNSCSVAVSRLIDALFVPVVCSFTLVSRAHVMHHVDTSLAKKTSKSRKGNEKVPKPPSQIPDVRMDLLTLLDEALNTLDSISPCHSGYTAGIRERIALESIRSLESLYSTGITVSADGTMDNATLEDASHGPESSQASHPHRRRTVLSRKDRLEALARKDATWYLCHILNSSMSTGGPKDGPGSMLNGALLDGAARIVKMCISMDCDGVARVGRSCVMDVMCRNMVLAACEKIFSALPQENPGL
ncbi:uncharacterized protein BJ212DRAFT_1480817 [Suillus subaureus]|uniref:Uncharacterized protein n=1 Tax=Suillus subaureus TaxID=48587 RepID=A0A9P7EAQ8_9AGAM|nr:uncharacterized protein BJ212DRAFT_1480817 [Suillus subaureus]KAG1816366.1 hypothetical protein BJ212DRAFT_1480817 [Suillus subaureus]